MKNYTLWIDHSAAHVIDVTDGRNEISDIINEHKFRPTKEQLRKFYHEVAVTLREADKILLFGPGISKEEFKNHCESHHPDVYRAIFQDETTQSRFKPNEVIKKSLQIYNPMTD